MKRHIQGLTYTRSVLIEKIAFKQTIFDKIQLQGRAFVNKAELDYFLKALNIGTISIFDFMSENHNEEEEYKMLYLMFNQKGQAYDIWIKDNLYEKIVK
jgi:hypothetical protein